MTSTSASMSNIKMLLKTVLKLMANQFETSTSPPPHPGQTPGIQPQLLWWGGKCQI